MLEISVIKKYSMAEDGAANVGAWVGGTIGVVVLVVLLLVLIRYVNKKVYKIAIIHLYGNMEAF